MWIQHAKTAPITQAAMLLEYKRGNGQSILPCPACGLLERGSKDKKRGPVGFSRTEISWKCHKCGAKGDVVDFVAFHFFQRNLKHLAKNEQAVVRDWFAENGYCTASGVPAHVLPDPSSRPKVNAPTFEGPLRPPKDELNFLWENTQTFESAMEAASVWSSSLCEWLIARRFAPKVLDDTGCVRVLPPPVDFNFPDWFPHQWAGTYRIAAKCYEPDGEFASIHCRSVMYSKGRKPSGSKTRWPVGYDAAGLLMANDAAVDMMKGKPKDDLYALMICEGITDFMRTCEQARRESINLAVVAGTSGSYKNLSKTNIPKHLKIFIATDTDDSGDEYAAIICDQLPEHKLYRMPLEA
tara:strand:+ start:911 stop:1969 length:1059 start_codon:yes stop_codon:yes gene_type:complete